MTAINIDTLEAGRELDALVAEKVMGWKRVHVEQEAYALEDNCWYPDYMGSRNGERRRIPFYSTDISAAWEVVGKGWGARSLCISYPGPYPGTKTIEAFWATDEPPRYALALADTAPLAICRAALKAVD